MALEILVKFNNASRDIKLLWASVFLRLLSYGLTNQVLTLFLNAINMTEDKIGLFMSLTLAGDVVCSYILTWYADSWGRRRVLVYGCAMMLFSGLVFSFSENFTLLLIFAIIGVISPSSDEVGPFKSIEEAMIAHLSSHNTRPEIYAIHALVGTMGSALGAILCGVFVNVLKRTGVAATDLQCYKLVFLLYAFFAFCKMVIMLLLSDATELDGHCNHDNEETPEPLDVNDETAPLMRQASHPEDRSNKLSKETVSVLMKLLVIFMVDSLGSGFMTSGWMVYYYSKEFLMGSLALGVLFFVSQLVMASSTIPSSIIARYFGPVRATLLVQIPSGIFSILIPMAKNCLPLSILFLNLHFATTAMDVTPRQILLTNIIKPRDLTKVMGVVNIGKTFARCVGPIFTGLLANNNKLWLCYIISGSLVILADLILACMFLGVDAGIKKQMNHH
ncbi:YJR124C [Saccharomyces arboricola H-6]|uniref:YJR124C n=1 Tax=Saccharomyces arboricola (strain H-6 / AS 2.3317 / CBS 10644) TaxID=1160507 RepID=J8Q393_SACAR|nr:YJR124C [Saccharomyces arboricola H-6]